MKSNISVLFLFLAFVLAATTAHGQKESKAPNFVLTTAAGDTVELARLKGKVVLVNFWATWCGPCRKEIPGFLEVYKKYKSKGLEIVGVSLDEKGFEVVTPFVKKNEITYPNVIGHAKLAEAYGGMRFIPTSFLVDKQGNIVKKHMGLLQKQDLEKLISGLL
jgi:cytochrome c biogenesis protein CcmG/thiol:disulfide interchange protein DsbE